MLRTRKPSVNPKKRTTYPSRQTLVNKFSKNSKQLKTNPQKPQAKSLGSAPAKPMKPRPIMAKIPAKEITELTALVKTVSTDIIALVSKLQDFFSDSQFRSRKHRRLDAITSKLETELNSLKGKLESVQAEVVPEATVNRERLRNEITTLRELNSSAIASKELLLNTIHTLMTQGEQSKKYCKSMHEVLKAVRGHIRVCCRIKPCHISRSTSAFDFLLGKSEMVQIPTVTDGFSHSIPLLTVSGNSYVFDHVFGPELGQMQVFEELEPYFYRAIDETTNMLVLGIGEKGSGKHYSLNGPLYNIENLNELTGMIPRLVYGLVLRRVGEVRCRGFNITKDGIEELVGNGKWSKICSNQGVFQVVKEFAMGAEKSKIKHSIFQIKITKDIFGKSKEFFITFAILEDLRVKSATAEEKEFMLQTYKALSEVLKVLVDVKLKSKIIPPYRASALTKVLTDSLTPTSHILMLAHLTSQDGAGTQTTLGFLRDSSLLV